MLVVLGERSLEDVSTSGRDVRRTGGVDGEGRRSGKLRGGWGRVARWHRLEGDREGDNGGHDDGGDEEEEGRRGRRKSWEVRWIYLFLPD